MQTTSVTLLERLRHPGEQVAWARFVELYTPLLIGTIPNQPAEPVAWTHRYGKSRVFYTSLGHPDDFKNPPFLRLLGNGVLWALDRPASRP